MKVKFEALVIRDKRNNNVVDVIPIADHYTEVQVEYTSDLVTPEELKDYVDSYMGKNSDMGKRAYVNLKFDGIWRDQQEAKDFSSVGNMQIGIEEKEIEWA